MDNYLTNDMNNIYEDRIKKAVTLFLNGYNCSQSVVVAFADMYGIDEETAKRLSAGFGGGVGRMRMICGAVSGMVILIGLEEGQTDGDDKNGKANCYSVVQKLVERSRKQNGSIICADLLDMKGCKVEKDNHVPDERNEKYYSTRPCAKSVESAARIFAEYLCEKYSPKQNV